MNRSRRQFQNRMCGQACRKTPRWHSASDFLDAILPIEVDKINRESHEECVNRLARNNPHAFTRRQMIAPQKALASCASAFGGLRIGCQYGLPRHIDHLEPIVANPFGYFRTTLTQPLRRLIGRFHRALRGRAGLR